MENPRIYVASLSDYNNGRLEGKWFDFDDYSDASELMDAIHDMLAEITKKYNDGEEREEWAVHDYENIPPTLATEYMGEQDFQTTYDIIKASEEHGIPTQVLMERVGDTGSDDYGNIAESLMLVVDGNDESDIVYEIEEQFGELGFDFWQNHIYIDDVTQRVMYSEDVDRYREDIQSDNPDMDEDEIERLAEEQADDEENRRNDDLIGYLEEMEYTEIPTWVSKDYESAWKNALVYDYDIISYDGKMYVFSVNYGFGGGVLVGGLLGAYIGYRVGEKKGFKKEKELFNKTKRGAKKLGKKLTKGIKYDGGGMINGKYLDSLSERSKKMILQNIANHYGISLSEAEEEVRDEDAEMLYEYISNNPSLRMDVYTAIRNKRYDNGGNVPNDSVIANYYGYKAYNLKDYEMDNLRRAYIRDVLEPQKENKKLDRINQETEVKVRLSDEYDSLLKQYGSADIISEMADLDERDGRTDAEMKKEWIDYKWRVYPNKYNNGGGVEGKRYTEVIDNKILQEERELSDKITEYYHLLFLLREKRELPSPHTYKTKNQLENEKEKVDKELEKIDLKIIDLYKKGIEDGTINKNFSLLPYSFSRQINRLKKYPKSLAKKDTEVYRKYKIMLTDKDGMRALKANKQRGYGAGSIGTFIFGIKDSEGAELVGETALEIGKHLEKVKKENKDLFAYKIKYGNGGNVQRLSDEDVARIQQAIEQSRHKGIYEKFQENSPFSQQNQISPKEAMQFVKENPEVLKLLLLKKGGKINSENYDMLRGKIKEVKHHASELQSITNRKKEVPAWVLAKSTRASTDLSDITHYMDSAKFDKGGNISYKEQQINEVSSWDNDEIANYLGISISQVAKDRNRYVREAQSVMMLSSYGNGGGVGNITEKELLDWAKGIDDENLLSWCGYSNKGDFEDSTDLPYSKKNLVETNFEDLEYVYNNQNKYGIKYNNGGGVGKKEPKYYVFEVSYSMRKRGENRSQAGIYKQTITESATTEKGAEREAIKTIRSMHKYENVVFNHIAPKLIKEMTLLEYIESQRPRKYNNGGGITDYDWANEFRKGKPNKMIVVYRIDGNLMISEVEVEARNETEAYYNTRKQFEAQNPNAKIEKVYTLGDVEAGKFEEGGEIKVGDDVYVFETEIGKGVSTKKGKVKSIGEQTARVVIDGKESGYLLNNISKDAKTFPYLDMELGKYTKGGGVGNKIDLLKEELEKLGIYVEKSLDIEKIPYLRIFPTNDPDVIENFFFINKQGKYEMGNHYYFGESEKAYVFDNRKQIVDFVKSEKFETIKERELKEQKRQSEKEEWLSPLQRLKKNRYVDGGGVDDELPYPYQMQWEKLLNDFGKDKVMRMFPSGANGYYTSRTKGNYSDDAIRQSLKSMFNEGGSIDGLSDLIKG